MYMMIRTIGKENVLPEDPVVLRYDPSFDKVGAFDMGGYLLGYVESVPPAGCADERYVSSHIGDSRVLARVAVCLDGGLLLCSDSPLLRREVSYTRIEREGYGILVRAV